MVAPRHPFPFFFHGVCDPYSVDRSGEMIVVFDEPPLKKSQSDLLKGRPESLSGHAGWTGRFLRVESDGDTFDSYMASNKKTFEVTHKDTKRFADTLDKWVKAMHAKAPIAFVVGPWRPDGGTTSWREWSESAEAIGRAKSALSDADKKSKTGKEILEMLAEIDPLPDAGSSSTPPKALAKINKLARKTTLELDELRLKSIPDEVRGLKHLRHLIISWNQFTALPEWLSELPKLQILWMAHNKDLTNVKVLESMKHLEDMDIRNVPVMPAKISAPLRRLFLGGPKMTALPSWVFDLKSLAVLGIEGSAIKKVPAELSKLKNLEELWLDGDISELPKELANLPKLRLINAADCKLTTVPKELAKMKSLKSLDLSGNKIKGWKNGMERKTPAKIFEAILPVNES
jgi:hypothetical protein